MSARSRSPPSRRDRDGGLDRDRDRVKEEGRGLRGDWGERRDGRDSRGGDFKHGDRPPRERDGGFQDRRPPREDGGGRGDRGGRRDGGKGGEGGGEGAAPAPPAEKPDFGLSGAWACMRAVVRRVFVWAVPRGRVPPPAALLVWCNVCVCTLLCAPLLPCVCAAAAVCASVPCWRIRFLMRCAPSPPPQAR